jgi:hypothetical protein
MAMLSNLISTNSTYIIANFVVRARIEYLMCSLRHLIPFVSITEYCLSLSLCPH